MNLLLKEEVMLEKSFRHIFSQRIMLYIAKSMQECSDFVAGSMLRSCNRYKALDETGVFGSACRHEFPAKYLDMKHGERYYYVRFMLL